MRVRVLVCVFGLVPIVFMGEAIPYHLINTVEFRQFNLNILMLFKYSVCMRSKD